MIEIKRMQCHLLLIRRATGWSAEEFGNRIGVTRQTINNIESGRNNLTKTQYIAMRSVLDAEISSSPDDTEMLQLILDMYVDNPENYAEGDRRELLEKANIMTPSILAGTATRKTISKEWIKTAVAIGTITANFAVYGVLKNSGAQRLMGQWLARVISTGRHKK